MPNNIYPSAGDDFMDTLLFAHTALKYTRRGIHVLLPVYSHDQKFFLNLLKLN